MKTIAKNFLRIRRFLAAVGTIAVKKCRLLPEAAATHASVTLEVHVTEPVTSCSPPDHSRCCVKVYGGLRHFFFCAEAAVHESIVRLYMVVSVTDVVIRPRARKRGSTNFDLDRSKPPSLSTRQDWNPGRRQGSAAPTSEALVRRKG